MKKQLAIILLTLAPTVTLAGGTHELDSGKAGYNSVGGPADGIPDRTVDVSLRDSMRFVFSPGFEGPYDGEVIRFKLRNDGTIEHEFSIGNVAEHKKHAREMRNMPGMNHDDPNTVSLEPGETATLTWRFKGSDSVVFACNIPGHYEAGMFQRLAMLESRPLN